MLFLPKTRPMDTIELPILSSAPSFLEGTALIYTMEGGVNKVTQSAGAANTDIFAGVAFNLNRVPSTSVFVDTVTAPTGGGNRTLTFTPLNPSTQVSVVEVSTGTALTFNAGAGAGQFNLSGTTITFNTAEAGKTYYVTYRYTLTVDQARMRFGDGSWYGSGAPTSATQSIGVIKSGIVYTDMFTTQDNWSAANAGTIKVGANGYFQIGGTGATVQGSVRETPTPDFPWLGLYLNTAA